MARKKQQTIKDIRHDLIKYLVNVEDINLTCGSNKTIQTKCPKCGFTKEMKVSVLTQAKKYYCKNCNSLKIKRPDLLQYLVSKEDMDLTYGSNKKIKIKCPECNKERIITVSNLVRTNKICTNILCKTNDDVFYFNENDIINGLLILEKIRIKLNSNSLQRGYKVQCLKDNYIYEVLENNLKKKGRGCPVCKNQRVVKGINDIATTHPQYIKYFVNNDDTYKYSW